MKILVPLLLCAGFAAAADHPEIRDDIDSKAQHFGDVSRKIWEFAEVGYKETKSSALLQSELRAAGFTVEAGVAGMPTAFVATYGHGKPVIGILGEYIGRIFEEVKGRPLYIVSRRVNFPAEPHVAEESPASAAISSSSNIGVPSRRATASAADHAAAIAGIESTAVATTAPAKRGAASQKPRARRRSPRCATGAARRPIPPRIFAAAPPARSPCQ